ncbi:MAG: copper amine oxidase N-terminal domain-containing protein [Bacillota bacterium]|jgi:hypothetical protein
MHHWWKLINRMLFFAMLLILTVSAGIAQAEDSSGKVKVYLAGEEIIFDTEPRIEKGRVLVPFRAVFESLGGKVQWKPQVKTVVARYGLIDLRLQVGSKLARRGNENISLDVPARIIQGRTMVPLRFISESLFSAQVQWHSKERTVDISPPQTGDLTPLSQSLRMAVQGKKTGELADISGVDIIRVPEIIPKRSKSIRDVTLLFSDSPEYVGKPGVTYRGRGEGDIRLVYYHINQLGKSARLALVAYNPGNEPARIEIRRYANGDQISNRRNWQELGAAVTLDYLRQEKDTPVEIWQLSAKDSIILNPDSVSYLNGELLHGIMDLYTDHELEFSFIMLPEEDFNDIPQKARGPVLASDGRHDRGTFPNGNQFLQVTFDGQVSGLMIGDGFSDPVLEGRDEPSGLKATLLGNYGTHYRLHAEFTQPGTAFLVPVGGDSFSGGVAVPQGVLPLLQCPTFSRALILGHFKSGDQVEWTFMPPGGSNLPVIIGFVPTQEK